MSTPFFPSQLRPVALLSTLQEQKETQQRGMRWTQTTKDHLHQLWNRLNKKQRKTWCWIRLRAKSWWNCSSDSFWIALKDDIQIISKIWFLNIFDGCWDAKDFKVWSNLSRTGAKLCPVPEQHILTAYTASKAGAVMGWWFHWYPLVLNKAKKKSFPLSGKKDLSPAQFISIHLNITAEHPKYPKIPPKNYVWPPSSTHPSTKTAKAERHPSLNYAVSTDAAVRPATPELGPCFCWKYLIEVVLLPNDPKENSQFGWLNMLVLPKGGVRNNHLQHVTYKYQ